MILPDPARRENRSPKAILLNALLAAASLFVNGFGVYLTIQANIGAGPWDVLNLGISRTFGVLYGSASIGVSLTILLIDVLLREPIGIAMFIDAVVVGKAVDFFNWVKAVPPCGSLWTGIPVLLLGLVILGLEVGWIYAYKAGWPVSTAFIVQSSFLAVCLLAVGRWLYAEAIPWNRLVGALICLVGLVFINYK